MCELPKKAGICGATNLRFYYDSASKQCKEFNYGGCGGNGNNFEDEYECKLACAGIIRSYLCSIMYLELRLIGKYLYHIK